LLLLWFGNQHILDKTNPVFGTARVLGYLNDALTCNGLETTMRNGMEQMILKAKDYLLQQQNDDGSWGGQKEVSGSIEETAMAVSALVFTEPSACLKGLEWLKREYDTHSLIPKPIGLYFASLWYHEKMYPLVWYLEALRKALDHIP
jgi:squalene-hopene/tetraprenyl-beta-curcumene cyclase